MKLSEYQRRYRIRKSIEKKQVKIFETCIEKLEAQIRLDSKTRGWAAFEEKYGDG